jgi:hypothetical protein
MYASRLLRQAFKNLACHVVRVTKFNTYICGSSLLTFRYVTILAPTILNVLFC